MWEDLTIALCTTGFLFGMVSLILGLVGIGLRDRHGIPRAHR